MRRDAIRSCRCTFQGGNRMARIAKHWTHERLAENLRAASHAQTIEAAAMEWTLRDIGDVRGVKDARAQQEIRCQLCNHEIYRYAVLANSVNGVLLIAGLDCLRKLVVFLESGSIEAPLRHGVAHRAYFNTLIGALRISLDAESDRELGRQLSNKTVLGWFEEELEAGRLPEDIARLVRLAQADVLPTERDAERLVAHYKEHRLLPIEVLVPAARLRLLTRFRRLLPTLIPIAAVPRVLRIIDRAEHVAVVHQKRRLLTVRRGWVEERIPHFRHRGRLPAAIPDDAVERVARMIDRDRSLTARLRLPAALAVLDQLIEQLRREIPGSDWYLTTDVEKLHGAVTAAVDQPPSYAHEDLMRRVLEWDRVVRHQLASPTVCVYIDTRPGELAPTVFHRIDDGSWKHERWLIREGHRPARSGVYTARLVTSHDLFALTESKDAGPQAAVLTLDVPLDHSPFGGRYRGHGGRDGERWVIPTPRPLWRAGTYRCLVLTTRDDHVLVYSLSRKRARRQQKP